MKTNNLFLFTVFLLIVSGFCFANNEKNSSLQIIKGKCSEVIAEVSKLSPGKELLDKLKKYCSVKSGEEEKDIFLNVTRLPPKENKKMLATKFEKGDESASTLIAVDKLSINVGGTANFGNKNYIFFSGKLIAEGTIGDSIAYGASIKAESRTEEKDDETENYNDVKIKLHGETPHKKNRIFFAAMNAGSDSSKKIRYNFSAIIGYGINLFSDHYQNSEQGLKLSIGAGYEITGLDTFEDDLDQDVITSLRLKYKKQLTKNLKLLVVLWLYLPIYDLENGGNELFYFERIHGTGTIKLTYSGLLGVEGLAISLVGESGYNNDPAEDVEKLDTKIYFEISWTVPKSVLDKLRIKK